MADIYNRFKRTWNDGKAGFGRHSYAAARAAGFSNAQISAAISGGRVGRRARDMVGAGLAAEQRSQASVDAARSQASQYQSQLASYQSQLDSYRNQVNSLSSQYQSQLQATKAANEKASEFEEKFTKASADYETAKGEADMYREQAVGNQLRALRSGATSGGNQKTVSQVGSLTGGESRFSSDGIGDDRSDLTDRIKEEGGLTDSVLARKGPVVERMTSATGRQTSPTSRPNRGLSQGAGTGSYYASRFG